MQKSYFTDASSMLANFTNGYADHISKIRRSPSDHLWNPWNRMVFVKFD